MTVHRGGRVALLLLAVVAGLWCAHGLRALSLDAQANARLKAAGARPDAAMVHDATSLFRRAARFNADPTPRLDEAAMLIGLGRAREAASVLEPVVRHNSGNIRALELLAAATASSDPGRSALADEELNQLYGDVLARPSQASIRSPAGQELRTLPGQVLGVVAWSHVADGMVTFSGWSASVKDRRPAELIVVVSRGRTVGSAAPTLRRPDVARFYHAPLQHSGFLVTVPLKLLEDHAGHIDVRLYGAEQGLASPLEFHCTTRNLPHVGC